jgi:predicted nuclease of predicted toxin-antitoxin system
MIIADENIDQPLVNMLRTKGYEVFAIREKLRGIADTGIIRIVKSKNGVLITEDKDFGELVFAYGFIGVAIIFLRFDKLDYPEIESRLLAVLKDYYPKKENFFITITKNKTRITKL